MQKKSLHPLLSIFLLLLAATVKAEITFPDSVYNNLDYGLYWFGYVDAEKAQPGQLNPYYQANRPTVIYVHGWQNNSSVNRTRETLDRRASGGPAEDLSQYWLDAGWNVGILYWNQFADESEVQDAEAKIWSASGPRNMRWRKSDGSYQSGPSQNVTELLTTAITANMGNFTGSELRITGHSLGNQLALRISQALVQQSNSGTITNTLKPKRVALLDPFYSNGSKSYLNGEWTGAVARDIADELKANNVVLEAYRSSSVSNTFLVGDANNGLLNKTAFSELRPWNFNFWQQVEKHLAAVTWYFWSFAFAPPQIRQNGDDAPSAATTLARTTELMNWNRRTRQNSGVYTGIPADDNFDRLNRL